MIANNRWTKPICELSLSALALTLLVATAAAQNYNPYPGSATTPYNPYPNNPPRPPINQQMNVPANPYTGLPNVPSTGLYGARPYDPYAVPSGGGLYGR